MTLEERIAALEATNASYAEEARRLRDTVEAWHSTISADLAEAVATVPDWVRRLSVDSVTGDNQAAGTEEAPILTIGEAMARIPEGGTGVIYLREGQTHLASENYTGVGRHVRFVRWGNASTRPVISVGAYTDGAYSAVRQYTIDPSGSLSIHGVDIDLPAPTDGLSWSAVRGWVSAPPGWIYGGHLSVRVNQSSMTSAGAGLISAQVAAIVELGLYSVTIDGGVVIANADLGVSMVAAWDLAIASGTILDAAPITRDDGITNVTTNITAASGLY